MKTIINRTIAISFVLFAISCSKENVNQNSSLLQSSSNADAATSFSIGQKYHGGTIFYIDSTGKHGLIASDSDLNNGTTIEWKKGQLKIITGANGTAVGTGEENTEKIIAAYGSRGDYAALLCSNYKAGTYKNWYLPSKDELDLLYKKRHKVHNLIGDWYWSSSEFNVGKAWSENFYDGTKFKDQKSFPRRLRAISSF